MCCPLVQSFLCLVGTGRSCHQRGALSLFSHVRCLSLVSLGREKRPAGPTFFRRMTRGRPFVMRQPDDTFPAPPDLPSFTVEGAAPTPEPVGPVREEDLL